MKIQTTRQYVHSQFEKVVIPGLQQFITIPNLSRVFDPNWESSELPRKAIEVLLKWVSKLDIKNYSYQVIEDKGYSPLLLITIEGSRPGNIMFYGHFDKQPHMGDQGWISGSAVKPFLKDGKLYGRGGADDGYAIFSALLAVSNIQKQGHKHPNVKVLIEGDQQSSSLHLRYYLPKLKERLGDLDACICLDSASMDFDNLYLTTSLRGVLNFEMKVTVYENGFHSGYSGIIPSSFRIARQLLSRLQDQKTGQIIKQLQVQIDPQRAKEIKCISELKPGLFQHFDKGCSKVSQSTQQLLKNMSMKAQMEIIGADGFPKPIDAGNILRPFTTLVVSIRLPPKLNPLDAKRKVEQILSKDIPYNAKLQLNFTKTTSGWSGKKFSEKAIKQLQQCAQLFYNGKLLSLHEGGSIGFLNMLNQQYKQLQIYVMGVLGPGSNEHTVNQSLDISIAEKLTCTASHLLAVL